MNIKSVGGKIRPDRPDGRLFLTDENLDRGTLTLLAAARRMEVLLKTTLIDANLTPLQTDILLELCHSPGLDVAQLRNRLGGTIPTIARVLGELDKRDLIIRPRMEGDGRRRALQLSEAGQELVENALHSVRAAMTQVYRQSGEPSVTGTLELLESITLLSLPEAKP